MHASEDVTAVAPGSGRPFGPDVVANLAGAEAGHFWFESRTRLIVWALRRYFPSARSFIEAGCGTGFVLQAVSRAYPSMDLAGFDLGDAGLAYARVRVPRADICEADATSIRVARPYDVAGAFDVLEHIPDDEAALARIARTLTPDGGLIVTVPQHRWLWSPSDDYSFHVRRYRRRELVARVRAAGFTVLHVTSFVSLLFPLMIAQRVHERRTGFRSLAASNASPAAHAVLGAVMAAERAMIRAGISWPFGGSLLVVARRKGVKC